MASENLPKLLGLVVLVGVVVGALAGFLGHLLKLHGAVIGGIAGGATVLVARILHERGRAS